MRAHLNEFSHGYKRHGLTTLFAALEIATGQVQAGHYCDGKRGKSQIVIGLLADSAENR